MSGKELPSEDELNDAAEAHIQEQQDERDYHRPHVRRRKTFSDYVTTTSALLGAIAAVAVFMGSVTDALPFVQKVPYSKDLAAADSRFIKIETSNQQLTTAMAQIQRNGLMTLQLQLQQRVDVLAATLQTIAPNTQTYYQINATLNEARQQLEEINRQLGR